MPVLAASIITIVDPVAAAAQQPQQQEGEVGTLEALRAADLRLNIVFRQLVTRNLAACDRTVPGTGAVLHARSSYNSDYAAAARAVFAFAGEVGVEGVVPGSPADRAGLRANDTLLAVNGVRLGSATGPAAIAAATALIGSAGTDGRVALRVVRGGTQQTITVATERQCAGRLELRPTSGLVAETDGDVVQMDTALFNRADSDAMLAVTLAHEVAHVVLEHPRRLTAARVSRGLTAMFGRNRRLIARTEEEADRLSPWLMVNAGYDPAAAVRFWETTGRELQRGKIRTGLHMRWQDRAAVMRQEIARIAAAGPPPLVPPLIATRGEPLR